MTIAPRFRWPIAILAAAVAAALITLFTITAGAGHADPEDLARKWLARSDYSIVRSSIPMLIRSADTVVVATVESIEGPMWNTIDGRAWDGNVDVPARVYSRIGITIEDVWAGEALTGRLQFVTLGDGSVRFEGVGAPPYTSISGGFLRGGRFVLFLGRGEMPFENGPRAAWLQMGGFQANWRIVDGNAIGSDLSKSMSTSELRARISEAWNAR
jgi:hypothetical protein